MKDIVDQKSVNTTVVVEEIFEYIKKDFRFYIFYFIT